MLDRLVQLLTIITGGLLFVQTIAAQLPERDVRAIIKVDSWSPEERTALENGEIVVRSLETKEKQELATLGVLRLTNLAPVSMRAFRESFNHKRSDEMKGGGRFGDPPSIEDLQSLELETGTIEQLRKCTVGKCDLNLSAEMIGRFQSEVDWSAPTAKSHATQLIREMLVGYVREYLKDGDKALGAYDNRRKTVDLTASHRSFLSSSAVVSDLAPELTEYLKNFPAAGLENVESTMHWSVVDFGLKPSITVSHAVAYRQTKGGDDQMFVASKQIYSTRYLDSSLTFTMLLRVATGDGVVTYLIFADRSRSDALDGLLGRFARDIVKKESIERIKTLLGTAERRLLVAGRPEPESVTISETSGDSFVDLILNILRHRTTLVIGTIVILIAAFALWRWKRT